MASPLSLPSDVSASEVDLPPDVSVSEVDLPPSVSVSETEGDLPQSHASDSTGRCSCKQRCGSKFDQCELDAQRQKYFDLSSSDRANMALGLVREQLPNRAKTH